MQLNVLWEGVPLAQVHLLEAEWAAASCPTTLVARYRYHEKQWEHKPHWVRYSLREEP